VIAALLAWMGQQERHRVRILTEGPRPAGQHTVVWDGTDEKGRAAGAGMYVYRLRSTGFVQTRKMVLVK
jgi:flagellar hook assembly protein FlgD